MGHIVLDFSMSLDGFVAGPNDEDDRLHHWAFAGKTDTDADVLSSGVKAARGVIDGVESALAQATAAAGDKSVVVGADIARQRMRKGFWMSCTFT